MKIVAITEKDTEVKQFEDQEWPIADMKHYGHSIQPDKAVQHYLKALDETGRLVGILHLIINMGVAEAKDVLVAHDSRSQGIGKSLMLEAEKIAKEAKAHKMFLSTGEKWEAGRFYEALGYKVTGGQKDHHLHHDYVDYSKFI